MLTRSKLFRRTVSLLLCMLMLAALFPLSAFAQGESRSGIVNDGPVNVRSAPGTWNSAVCQLGEGHAVVVTGEALDSDGDLWYQVSFHLNGGDYSGYIFHKYITIQVVETPEPQTTPGIVIDGPVNVRSAPGTWNPALCQVNTNQPVIVLAQEADADGDIWYKVSFRLNGTDYTGYIYSKYIILQPSQPSIPEPILPEENKSFEEQLASFPENYHAALRSIHELHPAWNFEAFHTGLDWQTVQDNENIFQRSLTNSGILSHYSTAPNCYDWGSDTYYPLESGVWYQASPQVVAYYMDPRNFLNEQDLFQFEKLTFHSASQTEDAIAQMLRGSFMEGKNIPGPEGGEISYAKAFLYAANAAGISAFHLVTRCIQEVGWGGTACSSGTYPGYEGFYNFFSIGASDGAASGMAYAESAGWDSAFKAIYYGAAFIGDNYISAGQDTPYFQKFSVVDPHYYYWHQYMTNIAAANSEGHIQRGEYASAGKLETAFTFRIPVYNNMPADPCALPASAGSPNNLLRNLWIEGYDLLPGYHWEAAFSGSVDVYVLELGEILDQLVIHGEAISSAATVSGHVGTVPISPGENILTVTCTAANGAARNYVLRVIQPQSCSHVYDNACDSDCNVCTALRTPADHVYDNACDSDCNVCTALRTPADHVYDNACDSDCNVCTALRKAPHSYSDIDSQVCKDCGEARTPYLVGDTNGDGTITSEDAIYLLYHTLFGEDRYSLNQPCDFNDDDFITSEDAIYLLYHTLFGAERYPL